MQIQKEWQYVYFLGLITVNYTVVSCYVNLELFLKLHEAAVLLFAILAPVDKHCSTFGRQLSSCRSAEDILDFVERQIG